MEAHLDMCLEAGLNVEGINAEVAVGQWEYQIFAKGAKKRNVRFGYPGISQKEMQRNMVSPLSGILSL